MPAAHRNFRMILLRTVFFTFLLAACALVKPASAQFPLAAGGNSAMETPRVHAELLAYAPEGVQPDKPLWLGLQITHQKDWHTYWKNPGDSGLPTELRWTLPAGVSADEIAWPTPEKISVGTLVNYGYSGTVLLPLPLHVAPDFRPPLSSESLEVRLHASWLVCRQECIPEEGNFTLKVPIRGSTVLHKAVFETAWAAAPRPLDSPARIDIEGGTLKLQISGLPASARGRALEIFPETEGIIRAAAVADKDGSQAWEGGTWTATMPLANQRSANPADMPLVLALTEPNAAERAKGEPIAWRVVAPVHGTWPAPAAAQSISVLPLSQTVPADTAASAAHANSTALPAGAPRGTFALALLGALLGGLLLNLMPCVFPVLAIKVLGFTRHAGDASGHRKAGLAYTAGVLLSFLALGGAMLALRAAGARLGWGFQLQSPVMVAALAALFTLIGLNLAGVFEFGRAGPQALYNMQARHPRVNDFLSGILAVLVASPCTAPFMGASLGFAIGLPAAQALLLFVVLGFGLALPYLLASFVPAVAKLLPRPGPWMDILRRLLAFPMFGTVVWLVWVLGQQSGIDGAGALLALLVCMAAVVWSLTLHTRARAILATLFIALTALLAGAIGGAVLHGAAPTATAAGADARWQPWSAQRAAALAAEGRPVFVDFTAAWCVTCQFNKKATLDDAQVIAAFEAKQVTLLRADWTRRDPAITTALAALGRNGVPVYVLQVPGRAPLVLREILRKQEVLDALAAL